MTKFIGVFLAIYASSGCCQTVLRNHNDGVFVERALVLSPTSLDLSTAVARAKTFLSENRSTAKYLILTMGTDETDLRACLYHLPIGNDRMADSEEATRLYLDSVRKKGIPTGPLARLIAIEGNAVIIFRNGSEWTSRVLSGSDPTNIHIKNASYKLLHLASINTPGAADLEHRRRLFLYLKKTEMISISEVALLAKRYQINTNGAIVTIRVRGDGYFLDDGNYPLAPFFLSRIEFPTLAQYLIQPWASCTAGPDIPVNCSGTNFTP